MSTHPLHPLHGWLFIAGHDHSMEVGPAVCAGGGCHGADATEPSAATGAGLQRWRASRSSSQSGHIRAHLITQDKRLMPILIMQVQAHCLLRRHRLPPSRLLRRPLSLPRLLRMLRLLHLLPPLLWLSLQESRCRNCAYRIQIKQSAEFV